MIVIYSLQQPYSFYGRVHGCIVDIDNFNHIYLNPYDGSVTPYWATSKYLKFAYSNVVSLIAAKRPEMLMAFNRMVDANAGKEVALLTLAASKEAGKISVLEQQKIDTCCTPVTDTSMNDISDRLLVLVQGFPRSHIRIHSLIRLALGNIFLVAVFDLLFVENNRSNLS